MTGRVAWYRFRATFHRRWGGYLALVLLVGLMGGLAMGTLAAARRTQSAFPAFLASTNPSDLSTIYNGARLGYDPALVRRIAHLPHVKHSENIATLNVVQVLPGGKRVFNAVGGSAGSVDGLGFDQDRITTRAGRGRLPDPHRADEAVTSPQTAHSLGLHLGSVVSLGFYTNQQTSSPNFDPTRVPPHLVAKVTVVGIGTLADAVVQDDAERSGGGLLLTPALTRRLTRCCANGTLSGLQLDHGSRDTAAVEAEIERVLPRGSGFYFRERSIAEAKAERAIRPEAIALGVFGAIAGLATVLIAGQVMGRQLRLDTDDLATMRALGADPGMTTADGLSGIVGALLIGSFLAALVAIALSPLAPIGLVRPVYPHPGIALDWTVVGFGMLVLGLGLTVVAVVLARRESRRIAPSHQSAAPRASTVARAAEASGLPAPAVTGIRFALEPGAAKTAVPVRSAILGAALAVMVVTTTLTFGASLHTLVSHPALYGWNWDYELETPGGGSTISGQHAAHLLDHDPYVTGWTGVHIDILRIDGLTVPIMAARPRAPVQPPLLSGHGFDAQDQVVLGPTTLSQLHKRVGDTVEASYGTISRRTRLRIVGTATMPAVGANFNLHLSMGTGALVSDRFIPGSGSSGGAAGPTAIFVRLRHGRSRSASLRALRHDAAALNDPVQGPVVVVPVQRPAEIVNYRSMGAIPAYLGAGLAVGAVVALGLTLLASVRRRRRDLALLKTLGFTRRQLGAVVAWQSSVAVAIGTVVGVPLGIVLGRVLWQLFARELHVVPQPTVPTATIVLIAVGALVLANVVALLPGLHASRTPATVLLRAE